MLERGRPLLPRKWPASSRARDPGRRLLRPGRRPGVRGAIAGGELTVAIMPGAMMGAEVPDLFDAGRAVEPKSGVDPQKNADVNLPRGIQSRSEFPLKK